MAIKSYLLCICFLVALVALVKSENLMVGITTSGSLVYSEDVNLSAIPLNTRTKNVFYNSNYSTIRGISCVDRNRSPATPIITSGGVGSTFVNIRLKGKRGDGLDYQVQIFV